MLISINSDIDAKFQLITLSTVQAVATVQLSVKFARSGNIGCITGVIRAVATSGTVLSIPGIATTAIQTGILYQNLSLAKSCRYKLSTNASGNLQLDVYDMSVGIDYSIVIPFVIT